jgi:Ni/Fe-hydrogenase subunit HybB-like protein
MLSASALAVLCALVRGATEGAPAQQRIDLGNLLLALTLLWGYLAFMQYLTIWVADLPAETAWYLPRTLSSWRVLAWLLTAAHFALPFAVLLSRAAKRRRAWLTAAAGLLVLGSLIDAFWLVVPGGRPAGFDLRWTDLLAPLGVGGLWCAVFVEPLRRMRWTKAELAYG